MSQMERDDGPAHDGLGAAGFAEGNAPNNNGGGAQAVFGEAAESVKKQARHLAEEQKRVGAERISDFGRAIHGAADELGKQMPEAASYIHSAARRLEEASSALQDRSIDEFVEGFSRFARRQPAAAFAGSVLAGFALSRFLKSSAS